MKPDPKKDATDRVRKAEEALAAKMDNNGGSSYNEQLGELQDSLKEFADMMGWDKPWGGSVK